MNETHIRRTFELMKQDNEVIEIRIVGNKTYSGYFRNVDNLIECIKPYHAENIYFVINEISSACYDRSQQETILQSNGATKTTSDTDIETRQWILIDIDSKRPSGVGATDQEKEYSKETGNKVYSFLRNQGFSIPICCDSGNGFHLLYKVYLKNSQENTALLKKFLQVLDMYFSTEKVQVDTSVFNASRITKLYGTVARKGRNTSERPHRQSGILVSPQEIKITDRSLIERVSALFPEPEKKTWQNNYGTEKFDLDNFISNHGIKVRNISGYSGGQKYVLEHCLFDHSHKGKDAAIFKLDGGAIGYKCFHSSCSCYSWKEVRLMFDPNAYDQKQTDNVFRQTKKPDKQEYKPQETIPEKGGKFLQLKDIKATDRSKIISMPSGLHELDRKIIGLNKGDVSLWSGKNASGKSSVLNQICLNACQLGFKGVLYSGELNSNRLKQWMHLQAAGRQFTKPTKYENLYYVPSHTGDLIDLWLAESLFAYNNEYGNNFEQLMKDIEEHIRTYETDFLVLDNVMSLNLRLLDGDKYQQQTEAILRLSDFAKKNSIHIHIVAHPRKSVGFLRKDDISGTADLTNAVDNVFIIHRVNNDFVRLSADFFGKEYASKYYEYDNVIEVCKNRDLGVMDHLVGLYYEKESKRFLNYKDENIVYGWQDINIQQDFEFVGHEMPSDFFTVDPNLPF